MGPRRGRRGPGPQRLLAAALLWIDPRRLPEGTRGRARLIRAGRRSHLRRAALFDLLAEGLLPLTGERGLGVSGRAVFFTDADQFVIRRVVR